MEGIIIKDKIIQFLKQPLIYVIILCIILSNFIYGIIPSNLTYGDTESYLTSANKINIFQGKLNNSRTPVYPYFIKIIKAIGGEENLLNNIATAQKFLFIITLILFYYCIKTITKNKIILFTLPLIFGIAPCIITWNVAILTESLALMEMVILSLLTLKVLKKTNKVIAGLIGAIILIMILTRPIFIYLLPIYLIFWVLKFFFEKDTRIETIIGIVSCAICGIILLIYCLLMNNQYGQFKLTTISDINDIISVIFSNTYEKSNNKEIIEIINNVKENEVATPYFKLAERIKEEFSFEEIKEFISSSQKTKEYLNYIINKTFVLAGSNIVVNYTDNTFLNILDLNLIPVSFGLLYIVIIISIIYLCYKLIKQKQVDWIMAFCISLILANIFTLIVGAPFEEQRLFIPSVVLVFILLAYIVEKIIQRGK